MLRSIGIPVARGSRAIREARFQLIGNYYQINLESLPHAWRRSSISNTTRLHKSVRTFKKLNSREKRIAIRHFDPDTQLRNSAIWQKPVYWPAWQIWVTTYKCFE